MNEYEMRIQQIENLFDDKKRKKLQIDTFKRLVVKVEPTNDSEVNSRIDDVYFKLNELSRDDSLKPSVYLKSFNELKKIVKEKFGYKEKGSVKAEYLAIFIGVGVAIGGGFISVNPAFVGIGLPIGVALGVSIGARKEKEEFEKGNIY